jgi:single-stranded DNA-binding protein
MNQHLTQGTKVYVEGKLRQGEYTADDGHKVRTIKIYAETIELLGSPSGSNSTKKEAGKPDRCAVFMKIADAILTNTPDISITALIKDIEGKSSDLKANFDLKSVKKEATKIFNNKKNQEAEITKLQALEHAIESLKKRDVALTPEDLEVDEG